MIGILGANIRPAFYSSLSLRVFSNCNCKKVVDLLIYDLLLHKYQFSHPVASKLASVLNGKPPQKCDSILSFLKDSGFSNAQLEVASKSRPEILYANLETSIKPKLRALHDLGVPSDCIPHIAAHNSTILCSNFSTTIISRFNFFKGILGTSDALTVLLRRAPRVLTTNLDRGIVPNIEFLKCCGVPMEHISKLLLRNLRGLTLPPRKFREKVEMVERMGFDRSSNMFICAVGVVSSFTHASWELKLQGFRDCGFSESQVVEMFRKAPVMFSITPARFKRAMDVILATGKYDTRCIINNPMALSCSIEKRYMPRFQILEILESKNLIEDWPGLASIYSMSNEKFLTRFVNPYLGGIKELTELSKALGKTRVKGINVRNLTTSSIT